MVPVVVLLKINIPKSHWECKEIPNSSSLRIIYIAQAQLEGFPIMSADPQIAKYQIEVEALLKEQTSRI